MSNNLDENNFIYISREVNEYKQSRYIQFKGLVILRSGNSFYPDYMETYDKHILVSYAKKVPKKDIYKNIYYSKKTFLHKISFAYNLFPYNKTILTDGKKLIELIETNPKLGLAAIKQTLKNLHQENKITELSLKKYEENLYTQFFNKQSQQS